MVADFHNTVHVVGHHNGGDVVFNRNFFNQLVNKA
jgi:hypothetical protein